MQGESEATADRLPAGFDPSRAGGRKKYQRNGWKLGRACVEHIGQLMGAGGAAR